MRDLEEPEMAIERVLRRDDLLTLAAAADRAVGIVPQRDPVAQVEGRSLFDIALERHLKLAVEHRRWAIRALAWDNAAVLVRYCALVGTPLVSPYTARELHEAAMRELTDNTQPGRRPLDKDLTLGVFNRYHAARDLRLERDFPAAIKLADRSATDLFGTGAEPHIGHYLYELGALYIQQGQARVVRRRLTEREAYWKQERAGGFPTHHRFEFIQALAAWSANLGDSRAWQHFEASIALLDRDRRSEDVSLYDGEDSRRVRELSVYLAAAEYLVATGDDAHHEAALTLGSQALAAAEDVRARWRVIARSRAPLAEAFHRVYGDIALLAHRIGTPGAARLGLRVALAAKSTGFAVRIRDGLTFDDNPRIRGLLQTIVDIENPGNGPMTSTESSRREQLDALRDELADAVSPMLADTVFPPPTDLSGLIADIGPRYVLDYVEMTDSRLVKAFFRTFAEPGGRMAFDRFDPGDSFRDLLGSAEVGDIPHALDAGFAEVRGSEHRDVLPDTAPGLLADGTLDFRSLAAALLPSRLTEEILPACAGGAPARLMISAHSWLSLIPWAALRIEDRGVRLVERAIISQSPMLTCLSGELPPRVLGDALVRLVGRDEEVDIEGRPHAGVDVALEREAWNLSRDTGGVALSRCHVAGDSLPTPYDGRFGEALEHDSQWQFLHIAAHGGGRGFGQYLGIPGEQLSAARALGLRWPASVLMASCHVGLVRNDHGAEPLSLVMALLTGGARCVVAGIDSVDDTPTGRVAAAMVRAVRSEHLPLDVALRNAQLAEIEAGTRESGWALLSAYVR